MPKQVGHAKKFIVVCSTQELRKVLGGFFSWPAPIDVFGGHATLLPSPTLYRPGFPHTKRRKEGGGGKDNFLPNTLLTIGSPGNKQIGYAMGSWQVAEFRNLDMSNPLRLFHHEPSPGDKAREKSGTVRGAYDMLCYFHLHSHISLGVRPVFIVDAEALCKFTTCVMPTYQSPSPSLSLSLLFVSWSHIAEYRFQHQA